MRHTGSTKVLLLLPLVTMTLALALVFGCTKTPSEPPPDVEETPVTLTGTIDPIPGSGIDPSEITIALGSNRAQPDTSGAFQVQANPGTPGLVLATDQSGKPLLMNVIPNPVEGGSVSLNVHTTALSLVFMMPFVCDSDPSDAQAAISALEGLAEFADFEDLIEGKLMIDPDFLLQEDAEIDSVLSEVIAAYLDYFSPAFANLAGRPAGRASRSPLQTISITPSYEKGGHRVTYEGGGTYKITNSLGRWAICETPDEWFFVFPNGNLLDLLKGQAFAPSQRTFEMTVNVGDDPKEIDVFGLGWAPDADNVWADLTDQEQLKAARAGVSTVMFEFVPHMLSVITNVRRPFIASDAARDDMVSIVNKLFSTSRFLDRVYDYVDAGNPMGLVWFTTKQALGALVNDGEFRGRVATLFGYVFAENMLETIGSWLLVPAKVFMTGNAVTSLAKTAFGFRNSRFMTTFVVERIPEPSDFGNISGTVHDKDSGVPLAGAVVILEGDDGNPLNPRHDDVTNSSGAYYFETIGAGAKTIRASMAGYNSASVQVTVIGGETITAPPIELSQESGTLTGSALDDILIKHGAADQLFKKSLSLTFTESSSGDVYYRSTTTGTYEANLLPGTYTVLAEHDDYWPDSYEVTVPLDGSVQAPKDLIMVPKGTMTGTVKYDLNNDGIYETEEPFNALSAVATKVTTADLCAMSGTQRQPYLRVVAGDFGSGLVVLTINTAIAQGPDLYTLGDEAAVGCDGYSVAAGINFLSYSVHCNNGMPAPFQYLSDPEYSDCNCGVTDTGTVLFDEFGTELTDVIAGTIFSASLAGWKDCQCHCEDTDSDGHIDQCTADCMRARIRVDFRTLVGSNPP